MQVNLVLVMASASAATAIGYLGKEGNDQIGWMKVCPYYEKFCNRVAISLVFSYVGLMFFLLICALSSVYKTRQSKNAWILGLQFIPVLLSTPMEEDIEDLTVFVLIFFLTWNQLPSGNYEYRFTLLYSNYGDPVAFISESRFVILQGIMFCLGIYFHGFPSTNCDEKKSWMKSLSYEALRQCIPWS